MYVAVTPQSMFSGFGADDTRTTTLRAPTIVGLRVGAHVVSSDGEDGELVKEAFVRVTKSLAVQADPGASSASGIPLIALEAFQGTLTAPAEMSTVVTSSSGKPMVVTRVLSHGSEVTVSESSPIFETMVTGPYIVPTPPSPPTENNVEKAAGDGFNWKWVLGIGVLGVLGYLVFKEH